MSKAFYSYIAKNIVEYFTHQEQYIRLGERYYLKLDTQKMVDELDIVLHDEIQKSAQCGKWIYKNEVYETYTLLMNNMEVAIVPKTHDMTEDFLATLRNTKQTMLMITSSPIDSIKKGAGDFSAKGMPFHKDSIIEKIQSYIESSSLPKEEMSVLKFELQRKNEDVFSDKSSLSEYEGLLSTISNEKIYPEDYSSFRLLEDKKLSLIGNEKDRNKRLKENNLWYERLDKSIRFGNVEDDFEKVFDASFIDKLSRIKNTNLSHWDQNLDFTDIEQSLEKKQKIKATPFSVEECNFYANSQLEYSYLENDNLFIRVEGTTASKQRKRNVLLFNPEKKDNIFGALTFNRAIYKEKITVKNATFENKGATVKLQLLHQSMPCSFHSIKVQDAQSNLNYEYRICVLDISPEFLKSIVTAFSVIVKSKKSVLQILSSSQDILINNAQQDTRTEDVESGNDYYCDYSTALRLYLKEDAFLESEKLNIALHIGNVTIPIQIINDTQEKKEITGLQSFKKKYKERNNGTFNTSNTIIFGTEEFFPKGEYRINLSMEQQIVKEKILYASKQDEALVKENIDVPDSVKNAYIDFLTYFDNNNLVPSLTYYNSELCKKACTYIDAVDSYFEDVEDGEPLNNTIENILKLGTIYDANTKSTIYLTPLHPMNVVYQLMLTEQENVGEVRTELANKLTYSNLLPYIKNDNKELYRVVEQKHSPEWVYYSPITDKRFKGSRAFVPKLISEKISEYIDHFDCLFQSINNKTFRVNSINMGDCREILYGLIRFVSKQLKKNPDADELIEFEIHIYGEITIYNAFLSLRNIDLLIDEYKKSGEKFDTVFSDYDVANILSQKIKCYFHEEIQSKYEYSHITFYEMDSSEDLGSITSSAITSGVMLEGILSGVPSVFYGNEYRTGFGTKYATQTPMLELAKTYNSLLNVANTSNPYKKEECISTAIKKASNEEMNRIYNASNWVTFIDPKVDLNFFQSDNDLDVLIIHYSDQYTSSSGYDAITVTRKSKQYENIIGEYLKQKTNQETIDTFGINKIINMFNAINGDWLLRLISSNNQFPREKISILSAIKVALIYFYHPSIIWIPISLEELLRVSGATGLSSKDGLLSAKKLGFEDGKTSDDILFVGIEKTMGKIKVHLYPIEVKIGHTNAMLSKAKEQLKNTAVGLQNALWPTQGRNSLETKMVRNFVMQLIIIASTKMEIYNVWNKQHWNKIFEDFRQDLLNENYEIAFDLVDFIGTGAIISFNSDCVGKTVYKEDDFTILEISELDAIQFLTQSNSEIETNLLNNSNDEFTYYMLRNRLEIPNVPIFDNTKTDLSEEVVSESAKIETTVENLNIPSVPILETLEDTLDSNITEKTNEEIEYLPQEMEKNIPISPTKQGMEILFGHDLSTGEPILWEPGNTDKILHTNTGIIGTMGTGKTQFTKSIIAQMHHEGPYNVDAKDVGILIFDYKGDYNESKEDFVKITNATILKLYHLPYNPFTLSQPNVFKPLLPIHVANSFKDTLSKVYNLGPKQENTLFTCINCAYQNKGIKADDPETWDNIPPTFADVYQIYQADEEIKKNDTLAAVLEKLAQFQIFESDPSKTKSLFDLLNGVVVVDLSGYDSDIQNLVVAITLDLFYAQMQSQGSSKLDGTYRQITKMILVDEADNFLHEGFASLKKILKEGREFGVGTILSTQFLTHFGTGEDDFSKYILTWVVHNVADLKTSDIRFVFNTEQNSMQEQKLFNDIKKLEKHQSVVKLGNSSKVIYMKDRAFWQLITEEK